MALIFCPSCGNQISDHAVICPHCNVILTNYNNKKETKSNFKDTSPSGFKPKYLLPLLLGAVLLIFLTAFITKIIVTRELKQSLDITEINKAAADAADIDLDAEDNPVTDETNKIEEASYTHENVFRISLASNKYEGLQYLFFNLENLSDNELNIFCKGVYVNGILIESNRGMSSVAANQGAIIKYVVDRDAIELANIETINTLQIEYSYDEKRNEFHSLIIENINQPMAGMPVQIEEDDDESASNTENEQEDI